MPHIEKIIIWLRNNRWVIIFGGLYLIEFLGLGLLGKLLDPKIFRLPILVFLVMGVAMLKGRFFEGIKHLRWSGKLLLTTFMLLSLAAQFFNLRHEVFPFVHWQMYSVSPGGHTNYYRYLVRYDNGKYSEWVPARVSMTFSEHRLNDALARLISKDQETHRIILTALAKNSNTSMAIRAVRVERAFVSTWPYQGRASTKWTTVTEFEIK